MGKVKIGVGFSISRAGIPGPEEICAFAERVEELGLDSIWPSDLIVSRQPSLDVACLMARSLTEVEWDDVTEAAPAVITAITMPFTFSIAEGIAFGFISYTAIKLATGRYRDIHPAVGILAVLFVIKYVVIG